MWTLIGPSLESHSFAAIRPLRVLYDFDGPRTFTFHDSRGELFLAHWSDEDEDLVRFLVVPWSDRMTNRLLAGDISVSAALDQPRIFVLDVESGGSLKRVCRIEWEHIPPDAMPAPEVTLLPARARTESGRTTTVAS